jgi:hypothetical protein
MEQRWNNDGGGPKQRWNALIGFDLRARRARSTSIQYLAGKDLDPAAKKSDPCYPIFLWITY